MNVLFEKSKVFVECKSGAEHTGKGKYGRLLVYSIE